MSNVLHKIAEREIDQCFHGLDGPTRIELVTSLIRQWIGNDGNAVIVTREFLFHFRKTSLDDGQSKVERDREPQAFVDHLRKSRVSEDEIPGLLHNLNVRQTAECFTDYGHKVRLRVDPVKSMLFIELVLDDDEWHRSPTPE